MQTPTVVPPPRMYPQAFTLPPALIHAARIAAAERDISMSQLVRDALAAYGVEPRDDAR